jgi:hypothetical protein
MNKAHARICDGKAPNGSGCVQIKCQGTTTCCSRGGCVQGDIAVNGANSQRVEEFRNSAERQLGIGLDIINDFFQEFHRKTGYGRVEHPLKVYGLSRFIEKTRIFFPGFGRWGQ